MNLTWSYVEIVEDKPRYEEIKITKVSPAKTSPTRVAEKVSPSKAPAAQASPDKSQDNKDWYFVSDNDVLNKELDLGRELLDKAVNRINAQLVKEIVDAHTLSSDDKEIVSIMFGLIEVASNKESDGKFPWD